MCVLIWRSEDSPLWKQSVLSLWAPGRELRLSGLAASSILVVQPLFTWSSQHRELCLLACCSALQMHQTAPYDQSGSAQALQPFSLTKCSTSHRRKLPSGSSSVSRLRALFKGLLDCKGSSWSIGGVETVDRSAATLLCRMWSSACAVCSIDPQTTFGEFSDSTLLAIKLLDDLFSI